MIAEDTPTNLKTMSGLDNVISLETPLKNETVTNVLQEFSRKRSILETETGYRVFSLDVEQATPKIIRALDAIGCNATKIELVKPSLDDVFFTLTQKPMSGVE